MMAVFKRSAALTMSISIFAQLGTACAPALTHTTPVEKAAEIVLPPSGSPGGLDRIRSDLSQFTSGDTHPHTRPAKCHAATERRIDSATPLLASRKCVVDVDIHSIGLTTDIVPLIGPARFRIIASTRNKDPKDIEDAYSLKPGTEYLIWVAPAAQLNTAGTSKTIWGFLELPAGSTGPIQPVTVGYVERCPYQNPPGPWKSDADFKDCDEAHPNRNAARNGPGPTLPAFLAATNEPIARLAVVGRTWFDCGGYCCTGTSAM
jgi:hypothetical protein